MVTSYYIMKMRGCKAKTNIDDYYYNLPKQTKVTENKCRVCLQEGTVPIYGTDKELAKILTSFAGIQISEDDQYTKLLCNFCHIFLKRAVSFRLAAKQSQEILKKSMKIEQDSGEHDYSDSSNNLVISNWQADSKNISVKKDEKSLRLRVVKKVTCPVCKKIMNRSYMKEHLTMHDPDHHKYVCEVCGKSFRLRCAYHNHRHRHRSDFPYKCQFCPYRGRYAELLKTHMRTHTGDYRYMCTECPARFLFKSNLNSHMLKHKEPKFKCDTCQRAFHTKLRLQRHFEADHLGVKNHVCYLCGKAFGYRNAMMKHQRHVHKREKSMFGRMPAYLQAEKNNISR